MVVSRRVRRARQRPRCVRCYSMSSGWLFLRRFRKRFEERAMLASWGQLHCLLEAAPLFGVCRVQTLNAHHRSVSRTTINRACSNCAFLVPVNPTCHLRASASFCNCAAACKPFKVACFFLSFGGLRASRACRYHVRIVCRLLFPRAPTARGSSW